MNNKISHDGLLNLEQPLVKVPFEQVRKAFRNSQKQYEKELATVNTLLSDLVSKANNVEETSKSLGDMLSRLNNLKRKLSDMRSEESLYTSRTKVRLDHLNTVSSIPSTTSPEYEEYSRTRLDRILVDYLLRRGLNETASAVAKTGHVEDMVDMELFQQSSRVEEALSRRSCTECLAWCKENSSSLRKMKSTLEFQLRLQEFIELARLRDLSTAIAYCRKHLAPFADQHMREIEQVTALLTFSPDTILPTYARLYSDVRWENLIAQFRQDNFTLSSLPSEPLLHTTLQAGLSALKTRQCYQDENRNPNCPVCARDTLGVLAEDLPLAHHVNSTIVCRITGKVMNENNPPMVLPNGYVYSYEALKEMSEHKDGKVVCPRSGTEYSFIEAKKVFIS